MTISTNIAVSVSPYPGGFGRTKAVSNINRSNLLEKDSRSDDIHHQLTVGRVESIRNNDSATSNQHKNRYTFPSTSKVEVILSGHEASGMAVLNRDLLKRMFEQMGGTGSYIGPGDAFDAFV